MEMIETLWGVDAGASIAPPPFAYTIRYDYDVSGNLVYVGYALSSNKPAGDAAAPQQATNIASSGPATSAAVWAIKKNSFDGSNRLTLTQWASGNTQQINIWDNRASLTYL